MVDEQEVGRLEVPMDDWLGTHVVEVLDAFGALQAPADGMPAVVRHGGLDVVQDCMERENS